MAGQLIELRLPSALRRRLLVIAEAGVLGRSTDEVVSHFVREALHRDWLAQEADKSRATAAPPTTPTPPKLVVTDLASAPVRRSEKHLLRLGEVCERIGLGRTSLYRMVQVGSFPKPKKLGARAVAWLGSDVDDWIAAK